MSDDDEELLGRAGASAASPALRALSEEECWARLSSVQLGRVAIIIEGRPLIFPINFGVDKQSIVFRTGPGAKLEHGPGSVACFEVDGYDEHLREGWSVMAVGPLQDITEANDARSQALRKLPIEPLAPGARLHWLALQAEEVTGRQFTAGWIVPGGYFG